jgi:hypothetical protein
MSGAMIPRKSHAGDSGAHSLKVFYQPLRYDFKHGPESAPCGIRFCLMTEVANMLVLRLTNFLVLMFRVFKHWHPQQGPLDIPSSTGGKVFASTPVDLRVGTA